MTVPARSGAAARFTAWRKPQRGPRAEAQCAVLRVVIRERPDARSLRKPMKVAGIIINYCTPELTLEATASLSRELQKVASSHIYVVDNASPDGSYAKLKAAAETAEWRNHATVVLSPENGGYGYGINLGARLASAGGDPPDYFFGFNSDATIDAESLARLIACLDEDPKVGLAGGRVEAMDGALQGAAFRFPTLFSELEGNAHLGVISKLLSRYHVPIKEPAVDTSVDWIPGTSMMMRASLFRELGGFDEGFFLYFEEVDYAKRVRDAGYDVRFVAQSVVRHVGSASTGLDERRRLPTYWYDSRHRYFLKHHGRAYAAGADAAALLGHAICATRNRIIPSKHGKVPREGAFKDLIQSSVKHVLSNRPPSST